MPNHEGCEFWENCQSHEIRREEWKRSQDQPQFSHKNNRCLHCAADHQSHDCPMKQEPQATTTSNPASGTGIYQNTSQFLNTSPPHNSHSQQHSQKSQSTVGITTPTVSQVNQQLNYQVRPPYF